MKKLLPQIGLLFLLFLPLLGRGQEMRISGRVVDADTKYPIPFVSVGLSQGETGGLTDENGYFQVDAGKEFFRDSLFAQTIGYDRSQLFISKNNPGDKLLLLHKHVYSAFETDKRNIAKVKADSLTHLLLQSCKDGQLKWVLGAQYAFQFKLDSINTPRKLRYISFLPSKTDFKEKDFKFMIYKTSSDAQKNKIGNLLFESDFIHVDNHLEPVCFDVRDIQALKLNENVIVAIFCTRTEHPFGGMQSRCNRVIKRNSQRMLHLKPELRDSKSAFWVNEPQCGWTGFTIDEGVIENYSDVIELVVELKK